MTEESPSGLDDDEREALVTLAHGAVVTAGGVSAQRVLSTAAEFVLARGLGPVSYGIYALAWRITQVLMRMVTFGSVPALQRFLPESSDDDTRQSALVALGYATTLGFGLVLFLVVWVAAPTINEITVESASFPPAMRLFGGLIGLLGVLMVAAGVFRATGSARGEVVINKLLRPGVRLVGGGIALLCGYSVVGVAGAILVCALLFVVVALPLSVRATGIVPRVRGVRSEIRGFYNHAGPVALSSLGKVFQNRLDLLLVGGLLTAVAAGVYNVVLVLVSVAWIPLLSFNQLLPPIASNLYAADEMQTLNAVYTAATRLIVITVLPVIAVLGVYGEALLAVFGSTYTQGYLPLVVYLAGVFVGSAVGATGWLLMMTDHQYARMALDWLLAVLNLVLTYTFVVTFGLAGAALGTSLAIAVQNGIQVLLLRHFEGLWPYDRTFLKPLAAGVVMVGVMLVIRVFLQGLGALGLGTVLGLGGYLLTFRLLGLDERDRLIVGELSRRYRGRLDGVFGR